GVLRVLTRNSATTYFIWRGELVGFEYDLAREFAERLGLRLEMVVPPSRDELVNWLREGRGDVVAAALTASNDREKELRVAFSRNYLGAVETVVVRADEENVSELADLDGREVVVRRSSSYWPTLTKLREAGASFHLVAAPEGLETEQIIARVADGRYDATVADSHIVDVELAWRDDIRKAFQLGDRISHGWAVRPSNRELLAAIDDFFRREYRGLFYNVTLEKYFRNARKVRRRAALRVTRAGQISDYDDLAREYARQYAFDWRLIVAQMHQESRFDPDARSFAGARGLLQVLPRTGSEFGFQRLDDPRTGVHAGVAYMAWLRNRLPPGPSEADRRWLTLASYNVGYGHVRDARRIARQRGWDPDQWFGHVEQAMLLKEDPAVHSRTRFGFARGSEPVHYVRAIRDRYDAYVQVAPPLAAADL
ncbi:MAG: transporter substrate-binding domain-containing protein, partial [Proteobacteria bacterium]|nr:transporter substrate-binding domain-containing protein [Pseudomonadota bacterium]